jgi:hypothetical protein
MKYRCIRKKSKFLVSRHFGALFSPRLTWEKPESSIFNKLSTLVTPIAIYPHECGDRGDDFLREHQY